MHALIIEDEPLIAMEIENILREKGYASFAYAGSADDAVAEAQNRCPDLITSDVALKPGNGIDAVEQICSIAAIPVIFLTSRPTEVEERLPAYPVLCKPFSTAALLAAVDSIQSAATASPSDRRP